MNDNQNINYLELASKIFIINIADKIRNNDMQFEEKNERKFYTSDILVTISLDKNLLSSFYLNSDLKSFYVNTNIVVDPEETAFWRFYITMILLREFYTILKDVIDNIEENIRSSQGKTPQMLNRLSQVVCQQNFKVSVQVIHEILDKEKMSENVIININVN